MNLPELIETPSLQITGMPAFCQALAAMIDGEEWTGTKNELLAELCAAATKLGLDTAFDPFWPSDAAGLDSACSSYSDFLEMIGLFRKKGSGAKPGIRAWGQPTTKTKAKLKTAGESRITFFRDSDAAAKRPNGAGHLEVAQGRWVGHWRIDDVQIARTLGLVSELSRAEAEALLAQGPPASKNRARRSGWLSINGRSWRGAWYVDGELVYRTLGLASEMSRTEAERLHDEGPPAPMRRPRGSGSLQTRSGQWCGGYRDSRGKQVLRRLGRVDEITREEAEAKLAELIYAARGE